MLEILQRSLDSTFSLIVGTIFIIVVIFVFVSWIAMPFLIISIKRELKKIRVLLEEKNKISLD